MRLSLRRLAGGIGTVTLFALAACSGSDGSAGAPGAVGPEGTPGTPGATGSEGATGPTGPQGTATPPPAASAPNAVYTESNDATANAIYVYDRAADGSLSFHDAYPTGGKGTSAGLGDQGALAFSASAKAIFAVNAGDNSISMLALRPDGSLALESKVGSGGVAPISVTVAADTVYALNAGDASNAANVSGFRVAAGGLVPIASSTQALSAANPGPAQIQFTPNGKLLVVTEKATSMIDTYVVTDGVAAAPSSQASAGSTPFGFAFGAAGQLVVSEAGPGAASSYTIAADGTITAVSSSLVSSQAAPCWVAVAGANAFVANAHSNTLTGYSVATNGTLALLGAGGVSAQTGAGPLDLAVSADGAFLYTLDSADHALSIFAVSAAGDLGVKPVFAGLPEHAAGLVAR